MTQHIKTLCVYLRLVMKKTFNGVLVVEGSNDASYISSFVNAIIVTTNGYEIPKEELDFLIHLPKENQIYILTDSDDAGNQIRKRLNMLLPTAQNLTVDLAKCNKNNKHGVAECDREEVINVLKEHLSFNVDVNQIWTTSIINKLGINNKTIRDYICDKFHLGICNNKAMIKRMNFLNIKIEDVKGEIERYGNQ